MDDPNYGFGLKLAKFDKLPEVARLVLALDDALKQRVLVFKESRI